ncbi:hypothetical protein KR222_007319 [Zaprionus bogoriensis]|nr:hypothetical protein KR222_007319 [Zaprionus bogoriensis]
MSNFECYLQDIAYDISCPNDPYEYKDFLAVKDYVLQMMCNENSYFAQICQDDILFGDAAHEIRLHNNDEYDVLMELRFPEYWDIGQVALKAHPGYVCLDFSQACCDNMVGYRLANNQRTFLSRTCLKSWLHCVFLDALNNNGDVLDVGHEEYTLRYQWRGITYTIYAESPSRCFSIDFVPAVKIERTRPNNDFNSSDWYAIPKQKGATGSLSSFTFMLANAQGELQHVRRCGQSMRDALRLMQALRDSKELPKLRCYHMVTVAIWMARRIGHSNVQRMCVSDVFLTLLGDLCDAFNDRHLGYVWDSQMNLLDNFTPADISQYGHVLCCAFNTLNSYPHQSLLSYGRCVAHFQ